MGMSVVLDLGAKQTEFTQELERLLNKYDLDIRYKCPKEMLAQYVLAQFHHDEIFGWVAANYGSEVFTAKKTPTPEPQPLRVKDLKEEDDSA